MATAVPPAVSPSQRLDLSSLPSRAWEGRHPGAVLYTYPAHSDVAGTIFFVPGFQEPAPPYNAQCTVLQAVLSCASPAHFRTISYSALWDGGLTPDKVYDYMVENTVTFVRNTRKPLIVAGHSLGANVAAAAAEILGPREIAGLLYLGPFLEESAGNYLRARLGKKPVSDDMRAAIDAANLPMQRVAETFRRIARSTFNQGIVLCRRDRIVPYDQLKGAVAGCQDMEVHDCPDGTHGFKERNTLPTVTTALHSLMRRAGFAPAV